MAGKFSLVILLALTALCAARDDGQTIVYSHRQIRPNADYEIVAQSFQQKFDADISASISTSAGSVKGGTVTLRKGEQKKLRLKVFSLPDTGDVKLMVKFVYKDSNNELDGRQRIHSSETYLQPMPSDDIILIQLDKPMYRAADTVRFRVLVLDQNLRLSTSFKTITVILKGADGVGVETKTGITYANTNSPGYFEGSFQPLPFEPEIGNWSVEVLAKDHRASKMLRVADYRLPRFGVYFTTPEWITRDDSTLPLNVIIRDQTGNPVVGSVDVVIKDPSASADKVLPTQTAEMTSVSPLHSYKLNHQAMQRKFCEKDMDGYIALIATAKERLTNKTETAEKRIPYYCSPFTIQLGAASDTFRAGFESTITIRIANHDGSPNTNALTAALFTASEVYYPTHDLHTPQERPVQILDKKVDLEKGMVLLQILSSSDAHVMVVTATVKDLVRTVNVTRRPMTAFSGAAHVRIFGSKTYMVGEDVEFMLECSQDCSLMHYAVVSGKGVALSKSATMVDEKSDRLSFKVTADMSPSATIICYFFGLYGIEIDSAEITTDQRSLIKDVSLTVGPQDTRRDYVVPGLGNKAQITVTADPNSLVGLLAVDKNLLQLASGHDLSPEEILQKLLRTAAQTPKRTLDNKNWIQVGNLMVSVFDTFSASTFGAASKGQQSASSDLVRKDFRDSFMFVTKQTDGNGKLSHLEIVPDSITTWVITAFAVSAEHPIGLTKKPSELRVYQELYIHMDTPHTMVESETTLVNITLFNFRPKSRSTTLGFRYSVTANRGQARNADLKVKQQNAFQHFPIPLGPFSKGVVIVTAEVFERGGVIVDKMQKRIQIIQPGSPVTQTSDAVTLSSVTPTVNIPVDKSIIPANVVPGSLGVTLTVFGDMWAPATKQLFIPDISREFEGLIRLPTGCGEQAMSVLMPNVFLARYLRRLGGNALTVNQREKKLQDNILKGFKKISSYRLKDGSYNTFGRASQNGSTWLTAYIVRGMALASEFVSVDRNQINKALAFLDSKNSLDGSFREDGFIIDRHLAGAAADGDVLTAFVLLAYVENGRTTDITNKARQYLESMLDKTTDTFALGLTCYVLSRMGSAKTGECSRKLNSLAIEPSPGKRCWMDKKNLKGPGRQFTAKDVETTSYALLALCNSSYSEDLTPVVEWLLSQRNGQGGFKSTQDTIVALNALSELKTSFQSQRLDVEVVGVKEGKFSLTSDSLAPKSVELPSTMDNVVIKTSGQGTARCQLEYRYQEKMISPPPPLPVNTVSLTPNQPPVSNIGLNFTLSSHDFDNKRLQIQICPSYSGNIPSGMIMVEIVALTGYEFDQEDAASLKNQTDVDNVVCQNDKSELYIRQIGSEASVCVTLYLFQHSLTENPAPRPIKAYRMYEPTVVKAMLEYSLTDIEDDIIDYGEGSTLSLPSFSRKKEARV